MSDERKKEEIGVGVAGEAPGDAEITDLVKPGEDEVGGRYRRWTRVSCPYCYALNDIVEETNYRQWFRCWNCRGTFQY
ncbi:MAG: hypothetical protein KF712_17085 [Akkermansiaceae bacterium]|nr:hypothetical protein [Akkermansiaceae bacterium]